MNTYYDALDNTKCEIMAGMQNAGNTSVRYGRGDVRHGVPLTRLRTEAQQAEWLLLHPKGKEYLHEVLAALCAAKRNPRKPEEGDAPWMANIRAMCSLTFCVKETSKDMDRFQEQYETATGETLRSIYGHPGITLRRRGGWANFAYVSIPKNCDLSGCPVTINTDANGDRTINNTQFVWELITREGFRLDP